MIREEYDYQDLKSFLDSQETVLIAGWPTQEERSFFSQIFGNPKTEK